MAAFRPYLLCLSWGSKASAAHFVATVDDKSDEGAKNEAGKIVGAPGYANICGIEPNFPAEEVALQPASPESPLQANVTGRFRWRFVGGGEETVIPARTGAALLFWRLAGRESLPMWGVAVCRHGKVNSVALPVVDFAFTLTMRDASIDFPFCINVIIREDFINVEFCCWSRAI